MHSCNRSIGYADPGSQRIRSRFSLFSWPPSHCGEDIDPKRLEALPTEMYFMRGAKIYRRRTAFAPILTLTMDSLSIFQRGNLAGVMPQVSRNFRTRTDFLLWQIAMSVRECSGTSVEHHTVDCRAYCPPLPPSPPGDVRPF
jgi:hypothetical protein